MLSYVVSRRTREIGIRVAIGAGRADVLRMVLGSGLSLALAGMIIGLALAAVSARLLRALLHGVTPRRSGDVRGASRSLLTVVAALASVVPAWRASRVDPVIALSGVADRPSGSRSDRRSGVIHGRPAIACSRRASS